MYFKINIPGYATGLSGKLRLLTTRRYIAIINTISTPHEVCLHDDVIKWKRFPRYWLFVRGIDRSPVNSPHKGQWRGALMFSLICVWINDWVNNREVGDFRRSRAHYDVIVMNKLLVYTSIHYFNCGPVTPYDSMKLSHHFLTQWLIVY